MTSKPHTSMRQYKLRVTDAYDSPIELKEDTVIVVLGASGDLAKKKTVGHHT